MSRGATRCAVLVAAVGAAALAAEPAPWHVPGAPVRARLERADPASGAAGTGHAKVWPDARDPRDLHLQVWRADGRPVGHRVLWSAEGEPVELVFDASGRQAAFYVYYGAEPADPVPRWEPQGGLVLDAFPLPGRLEDLDVGGATEAWIAGREAAGRTVVSQVFHGSVPFGLEQPFVARYRGVLRVSRSGPYGFAVASDGPSCLSVDGSVVVRKVAWEPAGQDVQGRHHGTVDLSAGRHRFEYLGVCDGQTFRAAAAWRPPLGRGFVPVPTESFVGLDRYRVARYETRAGHRDVVFEWRILGHCRAEGHAMLTVQFFVPGVYEEDPWNLHLLEGAMSGGGPGRRTWRWSFDDGTTAEGERVRHVFLSPGLRAAQLRVQPSDGDPRTVMRAVRVAPVWDQVDPWPEPLYEEQRQSLARQRDPMAMPLDDLASAAVLLSQAREGALIEPVRAACMARRSEFGAAHARAFFELAQYGQDHAVRHYDRARQALEAAVALAAPGSELAWEAVLELARHRLEIRSEARPALELLDQLPAAGLPGPMLRQAGLLRGDALLTLGRLEEARRVYGAAAPSEDEPDDRAASARRRARIEAARDLVRRKEWSAALELVERVETDTPLERLGAETGLLAVEAHIGRREFARAAARCRRLLAATPREDDRAEALFHLAAAASAGGRTEDAREALLRLRDDHPYSEAAARARDRWPDPAR